MSIPKVFISYSHDSQEHKQWVLELATKLRNNGIDATIDQWELRPGYDIPSFMESLKNADFILMICTENYVSKANSGLGGVGYEKMIITSDFMKNIDSKKVIPIIKQSGTKTVPIFIQTKLYLDFSIPGQFEFNYDELVRTIHKAPLYIKPEVGNNPFSSSETVFPQKQNDPLKVLMTIVIDAYENRGSGIGSSDLLALMKISRIMFDIILQGAVDKGLVYINQFGGIHLTSEGKRYAVKNGLINT